MSTTTYTLRLPPQLRLPEGPGQPTQQDTGAVVTPTTTIVKDKVFLKDLPGYLARHRLRAVKLNWAKDGRGGLEAHLMTERAPAGDKSQPKEQEVTGELSRD